jgi:DNA-binding NarL/FixJ family response regulator
VGLTVIAGYSDSRPALTPRMRQVLRSAAAGRTIGQTALELGLAEATVANIRAALCARLHASNITAAVDAAHRGGQLH